MTKSINHKFVFPLMNAVYFSATTAALGWMAWTYFGPTLTLVPVVALGGFFTIAACVALLNVRTANRLLVGSSAFTLNRFQQRLIRSAAILLPIPVLAYCASFAFLSTTLNTDLSYQSQLVNARQDFVSLEYQLFGRSALFGNPSSRAASVDVDFGPYMADLQREIKRHWTPVKAHDSSRAVATFKVHSDGRTSDLKLSNSSGSESFDNACLRAIQQKYRALPAGASESVDIQFTFDYNVSDQKEEASEVPTLEPAHYGYPHEDFGSGSSPTGDAFAGSTAAASEPR